VFYPIFYRLPAKLQQWIVIFLECKWLLIRQLGAEWRRRPGRNFFPHFFNERPAQRDAGENLTLERRVAVRLYLIPRRLNSPTTVWTMRATCSGSTAWPTGQPLIGSSTKPSPANRHCSSSLNFCSESC